MQEHAEGQITEIRTAEGTVLHNVQVPVVVCKPDGTKCLPIEFLVDTGADKSMISYRFGLELGLEPPCRKDKTRLAYDANNRSVHYIIREVDLAMGNGIKKDKIPICWCTSPRVNRNFLGMDFFDKYKLIIVGGKNKRFYITKIGNCVKCHR